MSEVKLTHIERRIHDIFPALGAFSFFKRNHILIVLGISILFTFSTCIVIIYTNNLSISFRSLFIIHQIHPLYIICDFVPVFTGIFILILRKIESDKLNIQNVICEKDLLINKNAHFAKKIGDGDFSTTSQDIDESDVLGHSLIIMRDNLLQNKTKETDETWITKGKELVSNELRLHTELNDLSFNILLKIIDYINVIQGAFYIYDDNTLKIINTATYAYGRKKFRKQEFNIGEGLIGQAAFEMSTIYRRELPENYTTITSGILGDKKPGSLVIIPLVSDDKLQGLIELASINDSIPALQIRFVEELSKIIARTVFNLKVSYRTEQLLREAQQMTEELQENDEELRQNAEEMHVNQEELEKMNQNLESKILEIVNSEQRLHSLLENASEVISIFNLDGTVRYESPSAKNILGYDSEEMIGTDGFARIHDSQADMVQLIFARLLKNPGKEQVFEFKYTKKNEEIIWLESIGRNLISNPAVNGIIFNTRDITLQKIAEKEQRMRSRMQSLSENSPDMIIRIGLNSEIFYANPKVEKFTGFNPVDIMQKSFYEIEFNEQYIEAFKEIVATIINKVEKFNFEKTFLTPAGELVMLVNAIPEMNEDSELESILVVAHDVTVSKMFEREIQDKNKKITESINYAYRIQSAILPDTKLVSRYLPKNFIFYEPRDVVSGDFPWFFVKGDYIYLAAVDCTGHGVPGALLSIIGYFILNNIVDHERVLPTGEILDNAHANVRKALKQDMPNAGAHDGMDIAFCKINLKKNILEFSGAHRPLYLLRNGEILQFKGSPKAIGGIPMGKKLEKKFETHSIQIEKGDRIFFFSDGLQDQINHEKMKYSPARIRELILANQNTPMPQVYNAFFKDFHQWRGKANQVDDILLISVEF